ncbi:hypothetical protein AAVH_41796 [Aphelenchoides avenae]|nr:hypothetical protein AAVH_41796 [Aphelenchus avenae]
MAYGDARKCWYLEKAVEKKDAKPVQVTCTNPNNTYCWSYAATGDGHTVVQKGCADDAKYSFNGMSIKCTSNGKLAGWSQAGEIDCCDKDNCNSAARSSLGFGLVTVAVAMLLGKAAI